MLCRFANQMLADAALAEEIVDDAIFYLWEHRGDIEIEYSIRAYLMRAVRNHCLNELNSLRRREELLVSSFFFPENMEFLDRIFVEDEHPLGYLLEQELESELIRNIEELPLECRTVFKKNRFEQKKYEEIAKERIILSSATDGKVPETTCSLYFLRKLKKKTSFRLPFKTYFLPYIITALNICR